MLSIHHRPMKSEQGAFTLKYTAIGALIGVIIVMSRIAFRVMFEQAVWSPTR